MELLQFLWSEYGIEFLLVNAFEFQVLDGVIGAMAVPDLVAKEVFDRIEFQVSGGVAVALLL